jgi:hypothetical protein
MLKLMTCGGVHLGFFVGSHAKKVKVHTFNAVLHFTITVRSLTISKTHIPYPKMSEMDLVCS